MTNDKEITPEVGEFLVQDKPRTAQFYLLQKIHKGRDNPPGRPIVSANDCRTERISQFVDFFLQSLLYHNKSHLKDTTDFINNILKIGKLKGSSSLSTMDVVSLHKYPHSGCQGILINSLPRPYESKQRIAV